MHDKIYEPLYSKSNPLSIPMPLKNGDEKIDVFVRVKEQSGYMANIAFVEGRDWPKEKSDKLWIAVNGAWVVSENKSYPRYPIKFRFRLDVVEGGSPIHIDQIVTDPPLIFSVDNLKDSIWRTREIGGAKLDPGLYRVRLDNLKPSPEIAWIETLFQFEKFNRKP